MKTTALILLLTISVIFGASAAKKTLPLKTKTNKTFVLVHGAWMAPYAWENVTKSLKKAGAKVIVVELPGHGSDTTAPQNLSLDVYKNKVAEAVNSAEGKVILVGHSLAGMIISVVAEANPDKIEKLIYVGAYLPANGQSLLAIASTDAKSLLGPSLIPSADKLTLDVKHENIINIFCADSSPATQALVMKNYKPEPAIPFTNSAVLTADNFGKVKKAYIHTLQDHVISIDVQKQMVSANGLSETYSLDSSHTPFLSMPDKLTGLLLKIAQ
ncbi:alpha/beta fold hydrolase [Mucilaginibacter celer]|uniref:Alpha/beta fold hydrolase n=1 Tax=Mucilaginibacter celer TaxID=2305508 RepID=A0A494VL96_9SPHI|nr:alpha/beta fold hydrolase [Mucilaginibacter celer]AYL94311.1 alpha/beta fold hydrolase [Mucilaginibacter celer]